MTNEEMIEHRVLTALRAMRAQKREEVVAVVEGMAKAFPKMAVPTPKTPLSLRLVVSPVGVIGVRQGLGHDEHGVLSAVSLGAVGAK